MSRNHPQAESNSSSHSLVSYSTWTTRLIYVGKKVDFSNNPVKDISQFYLNGEPPTRIADAQGVFCSTRAMEVDSCLSLLLAQLNLYLFEPREHGRLQSSWWTRYSMKRQAVPDGWLVANSSILPRREPYCVCLELLCVSCTTHFWTTVAIQVCS